jgi:outer membrane protein, heavy metal efflux system
LREKNQVQTFKFSKTEQTGMKKIAIIGIFGLLTLQVFAQTTREQAVAAALQNHPTARAAALDVEAKRRAEKSAHALANPEINAESPTGEFYTIGVLQSFDFPTVYKNRRNVARAETSLAAAGQKLSENELRFAVRTRFLELQGAIAQVDLVRRRDSIFQKIGEAANRQFAAGEIDFLQKTLVENETGAARQNLLAAQKTAENLREQLQIWTGSSDLEKIEPLRANIAAAADFSKNPSLDFEKQSAAVAARQADLAKSQNLPSFSLGYLNQGARQTPTELRFRAAVGVPLWFGQNRAARESSQTAALAAENRAAAAAKNLEIEVAAAQNDAASASTQIEYFEQEALPRSRSLIETATRLRTAGQIDYPTFLRTLDTSFSIENEYIAQLRLLNTAQIQLLFLAGN